MAYVKEQLGHHSMKMTVDIYVSPPEYDHVREAGPDKSGLPTPPRSAVGSAGTLVASRTSMAARKPGAGIYRPVWQSETVEAGTGSSRWLGQRIEVGTQAEVFDYPVR